MAMEERIKQSHAALKEYFSPSKRHQSSGNPAQLIVFAEHAIKVTLQIEHTVHMVKVVVHTLCILRFITCMISRMAVERLRWIVFSST